MDSGFVYFDFRYAEEISIEHHHQYASACGLFFRYSYIVVDPASINQEFWRFYAKSVKLLLKDGGKVLACTITENADLMKEILGLTAVQFIPSIPNLVYHYVFFTNYKSELLEMENMELKDLELSEDLQKDQFVEIVDEKTEHDVDEILKQRHEEDVIEREKIKQADFLAKAKVKVVEQDGERELESNIHWKNNKNLQLLLKKKQPNVAFYSNVMPCIPHGDLIDNIHTKWYGDYQTLEYHHGYIQWIFPNSENQGQNFYSVPLTKEEAVIIISDTKMKARVLKSFEMMLDFFGMRLVDSEKGIFERAENYKERYHAVKNSPHNFMRVTRILKSLNELGFVNLQVHWTWFLIREIIENDQWSNAAQSLIHYWIDVLPDKEFEAVEKYLEEGGTLAKFIKKQNDLVQKQRRGFQESIARDAENRHGASKKSSEKLKKPQKIMDPDMYEEIPQEKVLHGDMYEEDEKSLTPKPTSNQDTKIPATKEEKFLDTELSRFFSHQHADVPLPKQKTMSRQIDPTKIVLPRQSGTSPRSTGSQNRAQEVSIHELVRQKQERLNQVHFVMDPRIISIYIEPKIQPIVLFNFPGNSSPNGWRVQITLEEKKLAYKQILLDPRHLEHKSPAYLAVNERGKIPAIVDNGVTLTESMAIIQYLDERTDEYPLMPLGRKEFAIALVRLSQYTNNLNPIYTRLVYKARMLGLSKNDIYDEVQALMQELHYWDGYLSSTYYLTGSQFCLCDVALFPAIAEFVWMGLDLELKFPNVSRWFNLVKRRESIKKTWPIFMGPRVLSD